MFEAKLEALLHKISESNGYVTLDDGILKDFIEESQKAHKSSLSYDLPLVDTKTPWMQKSLLERKLMALKEIFEMNYHIDPVKSAQKLSEQIDFLIEKHLEL